MFTGLLQGKYLAWDHAPQWGKKGGEIGARSEPRGYIWRGKTTSLDHRWARFARRYFFLLDLFPHRRRLVPG